MPEMDGFELTKHMISIQNVMVNKNERRCNIVAATAYTDPENVKLALLAGTESVLFKPINNEVLK